MAPEVCARDSQQQGEIGRVELDTLAVCRYRVAFLPSLCGCGPGGVVEAEVASTCGTRKASANPSPGTEISTAGSGTGSILVNHVVHLQNAGTTSAMGSTATRQVGSEVV